MDTQLKTYTALLHHDTGTIRLSAAATSPQQAIALIAAAEGCPIYAVVLTSKK